MTAEPRDVEEITGDLALWAVHPFGAYPTYEQHCARERLLCDVEPLLDRLAAADRENAELRGEVERLRSVMHNWAGDMGSAAGRVELLGAERDDLRAQLAAAQAQLAHSDKILHEYLRIGTVDQFAAAEARLEAVRAVRDEWQAALIHNRRPAPIASKAAALIVSQLDAALSAAPQPEPDDVWCKRCPTVNVVNDGEHRAWHARWDAAEREPEPPASDEPARNRCTCDRAKEGAAFHHPTCPSYISDEPARCEHGQTEEHPLRCDKICDAAAGGSCFTPWCKCQCHHGPCPGPAASGGES